MSSSNNNAAAGGMINPHNPDFITKKPWYLTEGAQNEDSGPTLDHQAGQVKVVELSLATAEQAIAEQRRKQKERLHTGRLEVGQWVEALKKSNKLPYRICQILKIHDKKGTELDLQFEDGTLLQKVKYNPRAALPRIRLTKEGTRAAINEELHGKHTYDSKRDQYHGYDNDAHNAKLLAKYEERDEFRRKLREEAEQQIKSKGGVRGDDSKKADSDFDDSDDGGGDESDDEFVQRDEDNKVITTRLARQGGVGGAQMKITARNLRIREDTAKYLRNLDPNSAYYDPKSRSMRDNPNPNIPADQAEFAGDNFARASGDAIQLAKTQLFAWDAAAKGVGEIHPQANPSQAEILKKKFTSKAEDLKLQRKKAVLDKYGGEEYLDGDDGLASAIEEKKNDKIPDRTLRFGVSTKAEEYTRDGGVIKGGKTDVKREPIPSKYDEDIFINGHTSVWGSYFHKGAFQWGYADDHSLMKHSYCTGENGRIANDEAHEMQFGTGKAGSAALAKARNMLKAMPGFQKSASNAPTPASRSKLYGEADQKAEVDPEKLKEAVRRVAKEHANADGDGKKRKYNSMHADVDISEEDMEAYRLLKERRSDPMAEIGSDQLLDYKK